MRFLRAIVSFCVFLFFSAGVAAQSDANWQLALLHTDGATREIVTVTLDGIVSRASVPEALSIGQDGVRLSPDGRTLATLASHLSSVVVADLATGECCRELPFTDVTPRFASLAGFSPDGTQVAVAYMSDTPSYFTEMLVLDTATGAIFAAKNMTEPGEGGVLPYPIVETWRGGSVLYSQSCTSCVEGAVSYELIAWDPSTGDRAPTGEVQNIAADRLPESGEVIAAVYDPDYPILPNPDATAFGPELYGIKNAVTLSGARAPEGARVVYFSLDNLELDRARWVAGGDAFLVFALGGNDRLVTPNDEQPVDFSADEFLAATPDGWMTLEDGALTRYQISTDEVEREPMDPLSGRVQVLSVTPLGATASAGFAPVPPPEPIVCEGFVESRLVAGHIGRVVPGPANNVREEPSTDSLIVAKIAGGERFMVLEGPVCAEGMAWWRVAFQNWEGWTSEGRGENYWLEPAR